MKKALCTVVGLIMFGTGIGYGVCSLLTTFGVNVGIPPVSVLWLACAFVFFKLSADILEES